jgi:hypothetical protein
MGPELLADRPFEQLVRVSEGLADALAAGDQAATAQQATYLRALLQRCRAAADSVTDHLEAHGVSVDIVFEVDQLTARCTGSNRLLDLRAVRPAAARTATPAGAPGATGQAAAQPARAARGTTRCWHARWPSAVPRPASTTSPATARIPRHAARRARRRRGDRRHDLPSSPSAPSASPPSGPAWRRGSTTRGASCWCMLLHWTVATKQPAMTAPAMADKLATAARPRRRGRQRRRGLRRRGDAPDPLAGRRHLGQPGAGDPGGAGGAGAGLVAGWARRW